jgi:hypothetical protein
MAFLNQVLKTSIVILKTILNIFENQQPFDPK